MSLSPSFATKGNTQESENSAWTPTRGPPERLSSGSLPSSQEQILVRPSFPGPPTSGLKESVAHPHSWWLKENWMSLTSRKPICFSSRPFPLGFGGLETWLVSCPVCLLQSECPLSYLRVMAGQPPGKAEEMKVSGVCVLAPS